MKKTVLLFAAFLTALAAQAVNINGYEIPLSLKPIPKVSSFEWAETTDFTIDGEIPTAEDYTATPKTTFYQEDYQNLENWVTLPMIISWVSTNINETTGETFTQNEQKTIKSIRSLKNVFKDIGVTFLPTWNAPTFKKEVKTCKNGKAEHIYGADCVCIVCNKARREHTFDFTEEGGCVRCVNHYDSYDTNSSGYLKLKETQGEDEVCNATVPKDDPQYAGEEYHTDWWDEEEEDTLYNCSCECGYYAWNAEHHQHDFEAAKASTRGWSWLDENGLQDTQNHWKNVLCDRCNTATMYVSDPHIIVKSDEIQNGDYKWIDWGGHSISGECSRACGYIGEIYEEHEPDENCYCAKCDGYAHEFKEIMCINDGNAESFTTCAECIHCGLTIRCILQGHEYRMPKNMSEVTKVDDRDFHWYGIYRNEETHFCRCKKYFEEHYFYDLHNNPIDACYYCQYKRDEDNGTKGNKGDGARGANCVLQNKTLTEHDGKNCSTNHFDEKCGECGAVFANTPLMGAGKGMTVQQLLDELGLSSVDEMPLRAYLKVMDNGKPWMVRMNWVTKRYDPNWGLVDMWGYDKIADIFETGNRGIDMIYASGAADGKAEMKFLVNLFGIPHTVTNDFTSKITTNYTYHTWVNYEGTIREKRTGAKYIKWSK